MEKIQCVQCDKTIIKVKRNQRFCSAYCRLKQWEKEHPRIPNKEDSK